MAYFAVGCAGRERDDEARQEERVVNEQAYTLEAHDVLNWSYGVSSQAVALLVERSALTCPEGDTSCHVHVSTFNRLYRQLGYSGEICESEGVGNQPTPYGDYFSATGFLVYDAEPSGSRTMLTAGHVLSTIDCANLAVVFDYREPTLSSLQLANDRSTIPIAIENVFECDHLIANVHDVREGMPWQDIYIDDFAAFTIKPLPAASASLPRQGLCLYDEPAGPAVNTPVYSAGYMLGLPQKYHFGGWVTDDFPNHESFGFNLESFDGTSGAPVLNAFTHRVVGIHTGGEADQFWYVVEDDEECVTFDDGASAWLAVGPRATYIRHARKALRDYYDEVDKDFEQPRDLSCPY